MYKAPKKVIGEIVKLQRRFLWGGNEEQKKMSWVSWSQICKPKQRGGLGVKDLYMFNLALLTKWRWRILKGHTPALWLRVLESRYGMERPWFGNLIPVSAARKMSLWWRDLALIGEGTCLGLNWFTEVTKKRMGNGATIKFWTDTWVGMDPLAVVFPSVLAIHRDKNATVAELGAWTDSGWVWQWQNEDAADVFAAVDDSNAAVITEFVEFLQGIQPNSFDDEDRWLWLIDSPRGFTVKSCYSWLRHRITGGAPQGDESVLETCKSLWMNDIPSKVLIFCWRLLLNKLPTKDHLFHRRILSTPNEISCVFCSNEVESVEHIFCRCSVIKEVWRRVFAWLNVQVLSSEDVVQMYKGIRDMMKGSKAKRLKSIFWAATVYQIWLARNRIIFNNANTSVSSIVTTIKYVSWGWFIARRGRNSGLMFSDWFSSPMGCISSL